MRRDFFAGKTGDEQRWGGFFISGFRRRRLGVMTKGGRNPDGVMDEEIFKASITEVHSMKMGQPRRRLHKCARCCRIPYNTGSWTDAEHQGFVRGLEAYGQGNWDAIGITFVPTRSSVQIEAHACQYFSGEAEPAQTLGEGVQQGPGAGTSSPPPSPAPSLSPFRSSLEDGGFYGGEDGDGGGDGFRGEGNVFGSDGGGDGNGGGSSDGDGEGLGDGDGDDDDRFDDNRTEAPTGGRAIPNRRQPQLPGRQVWSRAGLSVERQAAHRNAIAGEAMRRSISVYDPLGIL